MMPIQTERPERERGQALILFSFMIAVLLLCVMCVVDVGFFLHNRELAQQTADAAALAGAQDLPDDPDQARVDALAYVALNGMDPAQTTVSLSCTSNSALICLQGDGRYDTIRVTPHVKSPTFFGPVLSFIGVSNCWVQGCTAHAVAAGCRGACGPIGTGPADIMTILDHSGSMSSDDLSNAKSAIASMFEDFNDQYQQVGVSLTPPTDPDNMCDTINNWTDPQVWLQAPLNNNFQTSPHVLDPNSPPVYYANCADTPSGELTSGNPWGRGHTNLGDPMEAAANELAANGRPDVTWGIIMVTDGAANMAPAATSTVTTSRVYCTAQSAVTSGSGDNNGYETSAANACANGGGNATDNNSGTNTNTSCSNSGKDRHQFYNFNVDSLVPVGATITGIQLRTDAWGSSSSQTLCAELSWDGGSSWTSTKSTTIGNSQSSKYFGGSSDTWGHGWTLGELSNGNLRVRLTDVDSSSSTDFYLDAVGIQVTYSVTAGTWRGPCEYAMQKDAAAKALGIEIYMIGFGLDPSETCADQGELASSPYYSYTAEQFLTAMATDANHFFNAPKNEDLTNIFASIGAALTQGSRLIE